MARAQRVVQASLILADHQYRSCIIARTLFPTTKDNAAIARQDLSTNAPRATPNLVDHCGLEDFPADWRSAWPICAKVVDFGL